MKFSAAALCLFGVAPCAVAQLPPVPTPAGNPTTQDKANLGKVLFWDEQLSSTRTVACGTCHRPDAGGADPRTAFAVNPGPDGQFGTGDDINGSPGVPLNDASGVYLGHAQFGFDVQVTGRAAPSMINAAYNPEQFWDGREDGAFTDPLTGQVLLPKDASLENQAKGPPTSDAEMAHQGRTWSDIAARVAASKPLALASALPPALSTWIGNQSYANLFNLVYGDPSITPARIVMAIAAYERTLISDQTPFDTNTLTPLQQIGKDVFENKGRCTQCHEGVLFRDDQYHNIGLRPSSEDLGRFVITGITADKGAFKTPGLRNVGLRTAFMHNGGHKSLAEVIDFYDRGGDFFDNLDPEMRPLGLTVTEKVALLDFLENGLTDPRVAGKLSPFDPPTLYTQAGREPVVFGQGGPGSGGIEPRLIGIEPPMLGNPNMTLTIADGLGGAQTALAMDTFQGIGFPFLGVPLQVGRSPALVVVPIGPLAGAGAGGGTWSAPLKVPATPSMAGMSLYLQALSLDPGAPMGASGSAGLELEFFASR